MRSVRNQLFQLERTQIHFSFANSIHERVKFLLHFGIVKRAIVELAEHLVSIFFTTLFDEPTR